VRSPGAVLAVLTALRTRYRLNTEALLQVRRAPDTSQVGRRSAQIWHPDKRSLLGILAAVAGRTDVA
jgi:hypothetical protein